MLLVNNPGVGITTAISLGRRAEEGAPNRAIYGPIVRRGVTILLCGLLLGAFPFVPLTRILTLRIPGVLQRIGMVCLAAGLISWRRSSRTVITVSAVLLFGYWIVLTQVTPPGQAGPTRTSRTRPSRIFRPAAAWRAPVGGDQDLGPGFWAPGSWRTR